MAERIRPRLSIDVTPEELAGVKADAQTDGVSVNASVLSAVEIRRSLRQLSAAGIASIDLKDAAGESVLELPINVFEPFLLSNPVLKKHLLKQNPTKP